MLETHFAGIITEKRPNFDPSTSPAGAENLHFTLNREIRRALGPPVTGAQKDWEDGPDELRGTAVPHTQARAQAA
jgi:hypothetical protein